MPISKKIIEKLKEFLNAEGLKWTAERLVVLEEIKQSREHLEADEILFRLRKKDSKISRATVYRTLELLVKSGFIQKITFDNHRGYYEYAFEISHHDHMVCVSCGKVIEFHDHIIEDHQYQISKKYNFRMIGHSHQIYGFCSEKCKRNGFKNIRRFHA